MESVSPGPNGIVTIGNILNLTTALDHDLGKASPTRDRLGPDLERPLRLVIELDRALGKPLSFVIELNCKLCKPLRLVTELDRRLGKLFSLVT